MAVLAPLVLVPVTLQYMGEEAFGVWMATVSVTAMAAFADLGMGQGLMTVVAPMLVSGHRARARAAISSTYALLTALALAIVVSILLISFRIDWSALLGIGSDSTEPVAVVCLAGFFVNVPLSLIVRVQYAAQQVSSANLWQTSAGVWSVALAGFAVVLDAGPTATVAGAVAGPLLANVCASLWFFTRNRDLSPTLRKVTPGGVRIAGGLGLGFLSLNVVMSIANNVDILLVGHFESAATMVSFAIATRLFLQIGSLVSLVNVPLWPANAEALAMGDREWVRRTTQRMLLASIAAVLVVSAPIIILGDGIFDAWTGENLMVSRTLLIGACAWWVVLAALSPLFMVQNSVGVLMPQFLGWSLFLITAVPAKVWVLQHYGVNWMPWTAAGLLLVTVLPGCLVGYRHAIRAPDKTVAGDRGI